MRPYFILSFRGLKNGFSKEKQYWNFIQSNTKMAVERAFGILKGRWRIPLKRIDLTLDNVPDVITACNICIIFVSFTLMALTCDMTNKYKKKRSGHALGFLVNYTILICFTLLRHQSSKCSHYKNWDFLFKKLSRMRAIMVWVAMKWKIHQEPRNRRKRIYIRCYLKHLISLVYGSIILWC
jgi:hypothetical protein